MTEDIILKLATTAKKLTGEERLVMAGGVALNCVANSRLLGSGIFRDIWIQPSAGDAGGAMGAAYAAWHIWKQKERQITTKEPDSMQGAYLGPAFSNREISRVARKFEAPFTFFHKTSELCEHVADLLAAGSVVGWFQGRMEYGPRALGNRSILGDPRNPEMQKRLNLKIKFREGFRPFAPSVLEEDIQDYFELDRPSPYMLLVAPVCENRRHQSDFRPEQGRWSDRLYQIRSDIPAVTHVDFSARVQSVSKSTNPLYWQLIKAFKAKTGYGLIINTSFNVRGEPIVCSPGDAYNCFMRTQMDYLVMGSYLFKKGIQLASPE